MPSVYKGKVGVKPRTKKPATPKCKKYRYPCVDGPMKGYALFLTYEGVTAQMNVGGQIGRYNQGKWEAACI